MKNVLYLALVLVAVVAVAVGCGKTGFRTDYSHADDMNGDNEYRHDSEIEQQEELLNVFCLCDSEEEAHAIADGYGIEFETYLYGVATFNSAKDMETLEKIAKEKDLPLLEINHEVYASED